MSAKQKSFKLKPRFDISYLEDARNDKHLGVDLQHKAIHLYIHPFHLLDFGASIKEILNKRTIKYSTEFGGIMLGYDNIKVSSENGTISNDNCFIHVDVEGDFYIFNPSEGQIFKGTVNKISKTHIGCLMHNLFNVVIPRPDENPKWLGNKVKIAQEIIFKLIYTNFDRKLPYIKGDIVSILSDTDSGISTNEECTNGESKELSFDNNEVEEKPLKKKKHKKVNVELNEEDYAIKPKKRKREHIADEENGKKPKRRKSNLLNECAEQNLKERPTKSKHKSNVVELEESEHVHRKKRSKDKKCVDESVGGI